MATRHAQNVQKYALRVTKEAGLRLRILDEQELGEVSCQCGDRFHVVLAKWMSLPKQERGCPRCSVRKKKGAA